MGYGSNYMRKHLIVNKKIALFEAVLSPSIQGLFWGSCEG